MAENTSRDRSENPEIAASSEGAENEAPPNEDDATNIAISAAEAESTSSSTRDGAEMPELQPPSTETEFKMPMLGLSRKLPAKEKSPSVAKAFSDSGDKAPSFDNDDKDRSGSSASDSKKAQSRNSKLKQLSPAERLKQSEIPIPYKEPQWGGLCKEKYSFEIVKNGSVIDSYDLTTKSFHVFGRLPSCDHPMEHPSLSRYHAVLQFCAVENERHAIGWYLYDLDSTHGTTVNKYKVKPRVYQHVKVGHVLKFGGSSRIFILQGPEDDQEPESELSVKELQEQRAEKIAKAQEKESDNGDENEDEENQTSQDDAGCTWGMAEDAEVEPDMDKNPFTLAEPKNEELYIDDPKKALKGFFEREGYDLPEYEFTESGFGSHTCRVPLPVDLLSGPTGEPLYGEATVQGKKKDAVVACALDACRVLDRHELLRQATHESRAKKKKDWEAEDYYGSDDDDFLDRTGDIEKKRKMRMKLFGHKKEKAETFGSLTTKLEEVETEINELDSKLAKAKAETEALEEEGLDALDAYMAAIKSGSLDTKTRTQIKRRLTDLRREQQRLQQLVSIAKPAAVPALVKSSIASGEGSMPGVKKALPLFGKIKGRGKPFNTVQKAPEKQQQAKKMQSTNKNDVEEEEESDDEEVPEESKLSVLSKTESGHTEVTESNTMESESVRTKPHTKQDEKITSPGALTQKNVQSTQCEQLSPSEDNNEDGSKSVSSSRETASEKPIKRKIVEQRLPVFHSDQDSSKTQVTGAKEHLEEDMSPEKKQKKGRKTLPKLSKPGAELSKDYCEDDPDYATWMPPQGQSGDGKTHLNAKFGY